MKVTNGVALDTQCLSYIIDAMTGVEEPCDSLADERKALFRTYLYTDGTLYYTRTVKKECEEIANLERRENHKSWMTCIFGEWPCRDRHAAKAKAGELAQYHQPLNDRLILAEAEVVGIKTLLTYDKKFLRNLRGKSADVVIMRPSQYWKKLGVPRASTPCKVPDRSNPLSGQEWWQW